MSLSSNTILYGIAVLSERVVSFFLIPVLTKAITPADYAIWAQSIVVVGVLNPLLLLGFQTSLVKFYPLWENRPVECDSVLLAMLTMILALLTIASVVLISFSERIAILVYGKSEYMAYMPVLAIFLASEALYQFINSFLRATHHFRLISIYTVFKGIWRLGVFLALLYGANWDFYRAFMAFVFIQSVFIVLIYAKELPYSKLWKAGLATGRNHWGEVLSFSFSLVALWIMTGFNNSLDRFFLAHFRGLEDLGAYSAAYSLAAVSAIFYSVLGFTLFPTLAGIWARGRREEAADLVVRAIRIYLFFILPFITGAAVAGQDVLKILTTKDYIVPEVVFLLLAFNVSLFGLYSIGIYILMLERSTVYMVGLMGVAAGVNALLNASLVPYIGLIGAALSGSVSNSILAGVTLYWSRQALAWRFPLRAAIKICFRACFMGAFIWLVQSWLTYRNSLMQIAVLFFAGLLYLGLDLLDKKGSLLTLIKQH